MTRRRSQCTSATHGATDAHTHRLSLSPNDPSFHPLILQLLPQHRAGIHAAAFVQVRFHAVRVTCTSTIQTSLCIQILLSFVPFLPQSLHRGRVPKGMSQLLPLQVKVQLLRLAPESKSAAPSPQLPRFAASSFTSPIFFFPSCGVLNAAVISPSLKILIRRPSLQ